MIYQYTSRCCTLTDAKVLAHIPYMGVYPTASEHGTTKLKGATAVESRQRSVVHDGAPLGCLLAALLALLLGAAASGCLSGLLLVHDESCVAFLSVPLETSEVGSL